MKQTQRPLSAGKTVEFMKIQLNVTNLYPLSHFQSCPLGQNGVFPGPILAPGPYV